MKSKSGISLLGKYLRKYNENLLENSVINADYKVEYKQWTTNFILYMNLPWIVRSSTLEKSLYKWIEESMAKL